MTGLTLLLIAGATWRLTRLLSDDAILDRPRRWLLTRPLLERQEAPGQRALQASVPRSAWLLELFSCAWCLSVWIAAAVTALAYHAPEPWLFEAPAALLSASAATGFLSELV